MPRCALCGASGFSEELVMHTELNHVYFRCKRHDTHPVYRQNPLFKSPTVTHVSWGNSTIESDESKLKKQLELIQLERMSDELAAVTDKLQRVVDELSINSHPDRTVKDALDSLYKQGIIDRHG